VYYGRETFGELAKRCERMNRTSRLLYLHGTMGTGKSHVMAACAAYLVANGKTVVFLPDCRLLAPSPHYIIRNALLLAFADSPRILPNIYSIKSDDDLRKFCKGIASKVTIHFLIDQVNALDAPDPALDRLSSRQKEHTRDLLDDITISHIKIQSGSGNYGHGLGDMRRQSSEGLMQFCGGLSSMEMAAWWDEESCGARWRDLLGEDGQRQIESTTGCLPIFLNLVSTTSPGSLGIAEPLSPAISEQAEEVTDSGAPIGEREDAEQLPVIGDSSLEGASTGDTGNEPGEPLIAIAGPSSVKNPLFMTKNTDGELMTGDQAPHAEDLEVIGCDPVTALLDSIKNSPMTKQVSEMVLLYSAIMWDRVKGTSSEEL
jgi:hypothetical protein